MGEPVDGNSSGGGAGDPVWSFLSCGGFKAAVMRSLSPGEVTETTQSLQTQSQAAVFIGSAERK